MLTFFNNLNERDKRHIASLSSMQIPYGGKEYIFSLLNVDTRKIELTKNDISEGRIRKEGAGRKQIYEKYPNIDDIFLKVLKDHTAGDPMNSKIIWTDLTKNEIIEFMKGEGIVSKKIVSDLLKKHGHVKRKIQKNRK